nr:MAG TPA: hypothetical protein [Caudoviricetes sp.]
MAGSGSTRRPHKQVHKTATQTQLFPLYYKCVFQDIGICNP